jgi:hypothetical protein
VFIWAVRMSDGVACRPPPSQQWIARTYGKWFDDWGVPPRFTAGVSDWVSVAVVEGGGDSVCSRVGGSSWVSDGGAVGERRRLSMSASIDSIISLPNPTKFVSPKCELNEKFGYHLLVAAAWRDAASHYSPSP